MQQQTPLMLPTLFYAFLKAGGLTLGDGYATIQPLKRELVKRNAWLNEEEFMTHLATVHAMPGIFNINFAAYLGRQIAGRKGSIAALLGMILPPMVVLIVFATFYEDFCQFKAIASFLKGARPAIVAIIAIPAFRMWRQAKINLTTIWIPIGTALAIGLLGVSPTYLLLICVVAGLMYSVLVRSAK